MTAFRVVGQCAHVTTMTEGGKRRVLLYRGAPLPSDVPEREVRHLLSVRLIAPVGGAAPASPVEEPPPVEEEPPPATEQGGGQLSQERIDAIAELPDDGSLPPPAARKAVWVEAAVRRGYEYGAASAATKAELVELLRQG
jgi:hypothetical protein